MLLSLERCHVTSVVSCSEKALFSVRKDFYAPLSKYLRKDFFGKRAGIPSVLRLLPVAAPPTAERRRGQGRRVRQRPPSSMGANPPRLAAVVQIPPLLLRNQTTTHLLHQRERSDRSHCLQSMEAAGSSSNKRRRPIRALQALIRQGRSATRRRNEACFAEPVSLPQMVDVLVNLWEAEGLDI